MIKKIIDYLFWIVILSIVGLYLFGLIYYKYHLNLAYELHSESPPHSVKFIKVTGGWKEYKFYIKDNADIIFSDIKNGSSGYFGAHGNNCTLTVFFESDSIAYDIYNGGDKGLFLLVLKKEGHYPGRGREKHYLKINSDLLFEYLKKEGKESPFNKDSTGCAPL